MTESAKDRVSESFDFAAAVLDRNYPEISVPVYLDEKKIKQLMDSNIQKTELETRVGLDDDPGETALEALEAHTVAHRALMKEVREQEYTVNIRGIAPEEQQKLEAETFVMYPREYKETVSPITGAHVKTDIPNEERELEFATRLRQAHLVSVVSPSGAVDSDFSNLEKVRTTFARLPLLARVKIDTAINEATIAVDFYRDLVDEVF
jgi:hypothetical protein